MTKINYFSVIMVIISGVVIILSFAFPIKKALQSKNDRLIESGLYSVSNEISKYYQKNKQLPQSLENLDANDSEAKQLINKKLVNYKIISDTAPLKNNDTYLLGDGANYNNLTIKAYALYVLCVNYTFEKNSDYTNYYDYKDDDYDIRPDTYTHPAGEVCYKLKPSYY